MFNGTFDELKEVNYFKEISYFKSLIYNVKYFKKIKRLKSFQKAEAYLELKRVSTMELFSECTSRLTIFAVKAPS